MRQNSATHIGIPWICPGSGIQRRLSDGRRASRVIVDETEVIVRARWYETARREGLSEKDCDALKGAFAYPGFRLEIQDPAP